MVHISSGDRVVVCGPSQSGKTYLLKHYARSLKRVVIFDLKPSPSLRELTKQGFKIIRNANEFNPKNKTGKYIYSPLVPNNDDINKLCWKIYARGNYITIFDELPVVNTERGILNNLYILITRGAERSLGVWIGAQRATRLNSVYFGQANHFFIFKLNWRADRTQIDQILGDGYGELVNNLGLYEFLYKKQGGEHFVKKI